MGEHISLTVNGERHELDVEPRRLLVQAIREDLDLTGTHVGCDTSQCGACTVHLGGMAVKSCTMLAVQADGASVTTIEGMATGDALHPLQTAFWEKHGLQCGFCTPGMIMVAADLLARDGKLHPVQEAFHANHALQCGFCTPGMIMQAIDLLADDADPDEEAVRTGLEGNLCRCTGYQNIVRAVRSAAEQMRGGAGPEAEQVSSPTVVAGGGA